MQLSKAATELYINLPAADRREVIELAADRTNRPTFLIEKDIWVVLALDALFKSPFGAHLVFKGGTSLSKVYQAIDRFSEDIDITYDIRQLASDLVGAADSTLPPTKSQGSKWTKNIRDRLPKWISNDMLPALKAGLQSRSPCEVKADGDIVRVEYEPMFPYEAYIKPSVILEFGGRSTGEPSATATVCCEVAAKLPEVIFPTADVRAMSAERTFWEKATAVHVYCHKGTYSGERYARHWYDLVKLDDIGIAAQAIADSQLAKTVANHKSSFHIEKHENKIISYDDAISGYLKLVPEGNALDALRDDYAKMEVMFNFGSGKLEFEEIIERCRLIEKQANDALSSSNDA